MRMIRSLVEISGLKVVLIGPTSNFCIYPLEVYRPR